MTAPRAARLGPAVAGRWYPAGAGALADAVDALLDGAPDAPAVPAVVAPHAGYAFSGDVAASAFRRFAGSGIARWILLGPSHYVGFRGARLPDASALATPLGDVPVDLDAVREFAEHPLAAFDNAAFAREHSLESELPFLQRVLGAAEGFAVIPVLVGASSSPSDLRSLAEALRPFATEGTGIVVSSDFTHYGEAFGYVPFRGDVEPKLRELDLGAAERIVAGDVAGFRDYCDRTGATICGRHAIETALAIRPARGTVAAYTTSGAKTGDWTHTVSYAAIALDRAGA
jgi:AmmeMemoRadiSam system protein B